IHFCRQERFRQKIVFIEDYDIAVSRRLVQGVDVWLNTPRRLLEASGTSGMKVNFNGGLNLSILDGWWHEAYSHDAGWAIGKEEKYTNQEYQDSIESNAIYDLLEKEIVPLFYERGQDLIPYNWISMIKSAMKKLSPLFNSNRMVCEYTENFYLPAAKRYSKIISNNMQDVKNLAKWKHYIRTNWSEIYVENVEAETSHPLPVMSKLEVRATVDLKKLSPNDVKVQIYYGMLNPEGEIENSNTIDMMLLEQKDGKYIYSGNIICDYSGQNGYSVRIIPFHEDLINPMDMGMVKWV
ncbi:alpha-glucan family phosphorylase, partial [Candidatus Desantisbacteria bacterium]|nr:alpha-glucan family phosphorylase [Candidatus Desantisbacteria bacterium]